MTNIIPVPSSLRRLREISNTFHRLVACNNNTVVVSGGKRGQSARFPISLKPYLLLTYLCLRAQSFTHCYVLTVFFFTITT